MHHQCHGYVETIRRIPVKSTCYPVQGLVRFQLRTPADNRANGANKKKQQMNTTKWHSLLFHQAPGRVRVMERWDSMAVRSRLHLLQVLKYEYFSINNVMGGQQSPYLN